MTVGPTRRRGALLRGLPDLVVATERLELRLPRAESAGELVRLLRDPAIARWTLHIPHPYTLGDARAWLRRARARRRAGTDLSLQIVRDSDGALVGGIGLHHVSADPRSAELGYWIGRPFRRRGYATEAAAALVAFAFGRLGLHRVEGRVFPGNDRSSQVLRAIGFRHEGRLRGIVRKNGRFVDDVVFARLATDAAPNRSRKATRPDPSRGRRRTVPRGGSA